MINELFQIQEMLQMNNNHLSNVKKEDLAKSLYTKTFQEALAAKLEQSLIDKTVRIWPFY